MENNKLTGCTYYRPSRTDTPTNMTGYGNGGSTSAVLELTPESLSMSPVPGSVPPQIGLKPPVKCPHKLPASHAQGRLVWRARRTRFKHATRVGSCLQRTQHHHLFRIEANNKGREEPHAHTRKPHSTSARPASASSEAVCKSSSTMTTGGSTGGQGVGNRLKYASTRRAGWHWAANAQVHAPQRLFNLLPNPRVQVHLQLS